MKNAFTERAEVETKRYAAAELRIESRIADLLRQRDELAEALRQLLQVESKSWPEYVRKQFAEARAALSRLDSEG